MRKRWSLRAALLVLVILGAALSVARRSWTDERAILYWDRAIQFGQAERYYRQAERQARAAGRLQDAERSRKAGDEMAQERRDNWRSWLQSLFD